ncbi:VWA domain-containing protein [Subsaximicrobium wynnwilliamsii]|uniref:VWA domain-containing protein n=1 Tax=Subsaximicrobium wynnwilliamsii TaxID=291179 RepID=A0A5C6ZHS6_9FLAO|nr:vWA domain-containing protein [Subsaximicrobium wynnwilliamsii]TXD82977.1 VWA domain-containing protein [Subsaximicrobium wynnwilliamsii]TXD88699.1 VWA domain-containing protein [Subsaximicrobium wynnwilliamsii]TXE02792.1 VWA domain-containing protein [Subsaximicrobium wynnwilliamsii]
MKQLFKMAFVLLIGMHVNAQDIRIKGTVSSSNDGAPLPGANVTIKGTTKGTQTDFDGKYSIETAIGKTLIFSYVGFEIQEIKVANSTKLDVVLKEDSAALEEVVVTAYGSRASKSSSSSIAIRGASSISGKVSGVSVNNQPSYGQLTAGEINDIEKWDEWLKALRKSEYKYIQKNWEFSLEDRVVVDVRDAEGHAINNVPVSLYNNAREKIMSSRTDMTGKAVLFKDFSHKCKDEYFTVQIQQDGKVTGQKITSSYDEVRFVLDQKQQSNDIDIMFTIDATGSMGDEIDYLKAELQNIISRLDQSIAKKRVALTFYRDHGDDYVVKDFDFNEDVKSVQDILANQHAGGGGDYEEAVEQGLATSMSKSWNENAKSKLLFLLLDAPPHLTQENVTIIKEQIKLAQAKGIKIIPIVASGANKNVEFLMRFFSVSTNGTYVFLTDDSGIGNAHIDPTTDKFKVEKLNDLIVRLIEKYAGVAS